MKKKPTLIKLISGIEVIGNIKKRTPTQLVLTNPVQINYKNEFSSLPHVSLTRYMQFANTRDISFERSLIVSEAGVIEGMGGYYEIAVDQMVKEIDGIISEELDRASNTSDSPTETMYKAILEGFNGPLN